MPADNELTAKLTRRLDRNEALEQGQQVTNTYRTTGVSIYSEFSEFSRKQIKEYEQAFKKSLPIIRLTFALKDHLSFLSSQRF